MSNDASPCEDSPMKLIRRPHFCRPASNSSGALLEVEMFLEVASELGVELRFETCCDATSAEAQEKLKFLSGQLRELRRKWEAWKDRSEEAPDLIAKLASCNDADLLLSPLETQQLLQLLTRLLRRRKRLPEAELLRSKLSSLALHLDSKMQEVHELQTYLTDIVTENELLRRENSELAQRITYFKQAFEEMGSASELCATSEFPNMSFSAGEEVTCSQDKRHDIGSEKENEPPAERPRHRQRAPTFSSGDFLNAQCVCREEPKRS